MIPGQPALCEGTVAHHRFGPQPHRFSNRVSQVWIDPDRPADLCDLHPAWSHSYPAPARFRRSDYGLQPTGSLADAARHDLGKILGRTPQGPVRMLSQIRRWGWLFNPISVFFVWDEPAVSNAGPPSPIGAVLEVTNTPWKERTRYSVVFDTFGGTLNAEFDKAMHVSPFLGMDHRYRLTVHDRDDIVAIDIGVVQRDGSEILNTKLRLQRRGANRVLLGKAIRSEPFPTHRVSASIHAQAMRLWAKGVPVIAHQRKKQPAKPLSRSSTEEDL